MMIETEDFKNDNFRLSCSLYEMLEIWSMRGHKVELKYVDQHGNEKAVEGKITNIYSRDGLEQMVLDETLIVPTRNIILINDVSFNEYLK